MENREFEKEEVQEVVHGFKVFGFDWTCSPNGNTKQYSCPGKFEEDVTPVRCGQGMHFCEIAVDCFNYYSFDSNNKVAEVIAYGQVVREGDKSCTNKLEIVREISWDEVLKLVNHGKNCTGRCNTGDWNTGDCNTGNCNTGDWNTGNRNTGNCNTGDWNTGNRNTGNRNTGNCNTGNWNTGNRNTGDCNTGNRNTGDRNTGDCNTGNRNTGNRNTGDRNTGDWNKSSFNNGCFMTVEPKIMMFNKPSDWTYRNWLESDACYLLNRIQKNVVEWIYSCDMTDEEKAANPSFETTGGYLKVLDESECGQLWWDGLGEANRDIIRSMPNFDAAIFEEITGIKTE